MHPRCWRSSWPIGRSSLRRSRTAATRSSNISPNNTTSEWPNRTRGIGAFYLLVDGDSVLGRFNLIFGPEHTAALGYRVAQHVCGQGLATATVRELCRLAATRHGVRTVRAATADSNPASQRVLAKAGFVAIGPAEPADVGGKSGTWYERDLTAESGERAFAHSE
jgi:RimJ/RimL family protein N-acetyltransferase